MKKVLLLFILLVIAVSFFSFAVAQDSDSVLSPSSDNKIQGDVPEAIKTNLQKVEDITGGIMEKEVSLPSPFDRIMQSLFNLEKTPTLQELILLLGGFIVLFLIITDILALMPMFEKPLIKYTSAFVVVAIISISNGLDLLKIFLMGILDMFNSKVASAIAIIVTIVVIFFILKWLKKMKEKSEVEGAEAEGIKAGAGAKILENLSTEYKK